MLLAANKNLESCDITIAPAADGGYCLIAMKRDSFLPTVFQNILWSTDAVLKNTLEKCEEFRMEVELLEALLDIDTMDDLNAYLLKPSASAYSTNKWIGNL